jgi:DnaA-homolog protein
VTEFAPQIPLDLFEPEAPSFANFLVGHNEELVTRLYAIASGMRLSGALSIWGGVNSGKTHLLNSLFSSLHAQENEMIKLEADKPFPENPFIDVQLVIVDDADRLSALQQSWLFNAFNHVVAAGGLVIASGASSPLTWPIRDDLRTRLASGLIFELHAAPQDELPLLLQEYARGRGISLSEEVLTYILTYSRRDVAALCQTIYGVDRLSLSMKRAITIPLVRAYLAQHDSHASTTNIGV